MAARKDIYKDAKGFDKNPQNINKNGRPLNRPLKEYLVELEGKENKIQIPLSACQIVGDMVIIKLPSKENMAVTLFKNAIKDVRWFQEWAKITGEYAPTKGEITGKNGEPLNAAPTIILQYEGKPIDLKT